jgi:hypothetical protein
MSDNNHQEFIKNIATIRANLTASYQDRNQDTEKQVKAAVSAVLSQENIVISAKDNEVMSKYAAKFSFVPPNNVIKKVSDALTNIENGYKKQRALIAKGNSLIEFQKSGIGQAATATMSVRETLSENKVEELKANLDTFKESDAIDDKKSQALAEKRKNLFKVGAPLLATGGLMFSLLSPTMGVGLMLFSVSLLLSGAAISYKAYNMGEDSKVAQKKEDLMLTSLDQAKDNLVSTHKFKDNISNIAESSKVGGNNEQSQAAVTNIQQVNSEQISRS